MENPLNTPEMREEIRQLRINAQTAPINVAGLENWLMGNNVEKGFAKQMPYIPANERLVMELNANKTRYD